MEQAEAAQKHMAAVEGAKRDNSQCSITDDQVKEMWLHMRPEVRATFENWARANACMSLPLPCILRSPLPCTSHCCRYDSPFAWPFHTSLSSIPPLS